MRRPKYDSDRPLRLHIWCAPLSAPFTSFKIASLNFKCNLIINSGSCFWLGRSNFASNKCEYHLKPDFLSTNVIMIPKRITWLMHSLIELGACWLLDGLLQMLNYFALSPTNRRRRRFSRSRCWRHTFFLLFRLAFHFCSIYRMLGL